MKTFVKVILRGLLVIFITALFVLITLILMIKMICSDISESAKELFATTMLETGQMKFVATMFLSKEELQELVNRNSVETMSAEVDTDLIKFDANSTEKDQPDMEIVEISGTTYFAKMLIVKDPSKVKIATTYPWSEYGVELDKLVTNNNAIAGVNGGLYESTGNKGGKPLGVVVCNGEIQYNNPSGYAGLHLIAFDENNVLRISSIEGMSKKDIEELVKNEKIRDAVTFQEESSDANNHFVKLIINGEERQFDGKGSGANPRTAIGQREDGTVLLLVTDGRGASGHLGATAADLISIMKEYGAVNAANLDGGSSSSMYYKDHYEMSSVTFYYANSSWKLPTGFIVEK